MGIKSPLRIHSLLSTLEGEEEREREIIHNHRLYTYEITNQTIVASSPMVK